VRLRKEERERSVAFFNGIGKPPIEFFFLFFLTLFLFSFLFDPVLQVYLRLARVPLTIQECNSARSGPTGEGMRGERGLTRICEASRLADRWPNAHLLRSLSLSSSAPSPSPPPLSPSPPPLPLPLSSSAPSPSPPPLPLPHLLRSLPLTLALSLSLSLSPSLSRSLPPPGTCPALEHRGELVDAPAGSAAAPTEAASLIIAHARRADASATFDLDAGLSAADAAEAAAWRALAAAALEPASAFAAWCDQSAYDEFTKKEYGAGLPFPLSALIPRSTRRGVSARFFGPGSGGAAATAVRERVLSDAVAAHAAVAARLSSSSSASSRGSAAVGPFFFGKAPSSVDALLFAHLSFHARAPVSPPELRESVRCRPEIARYLAAVAEAAGLGPEQAAAAAAPPLPYIPGSGWEASAAAAARAARAASPNDFLGGRLGAIPAGGRRAGGGKRGGGGEGSGWWPFGRKTDSDGGGAAAKRDLSHRRGNALWVVSVTALVLGYIALSGQYFTIEWEDLDQEGGGGDGGGDGGDVVAE